MVMKLNVAICGLAVVLMSPAAASAQTTAQEVKDKTTTAAQKTAQVATDAEITSAVKTKLLADTTVGGLKIDVDTKNGVVTLTGPVHSGAEKDQALSLAKGTSGVKRVVNKLKIETEGTAGHKDIGDKTKDAADATKDATVKAGKATEKGVEKAAKATKDAAVKTEDVAADAA